MTEEELKALEADYTRAGPVGRLVAEVRQLNATLANAYEASDKKLQQVRAERDRALEERDAAQRALAESQAREAELRAALKKTACPECRHLVNAEGRECRAEDKHGWRFCNCVLDHHQPVLARPAADSALREFGLKVGYRVARRPELRDARDTVEAAVDAVLRGER